MTRADGSGLSMKFDKRTSNFALDAFRAWITTITRQTALNTLVASLFASCRSGSAGAQTFPPSVGFVGGTCSGSFFTYMTFVDMSREKIRARKLVAAVLAFVGAVASVGSHMPNDMLGPSECRSTNGAFVISTHVSTLWSFCCSIFFSVEIFLERFLVVEIFQQTV
jgi:hypothetical protein